MQDGHMLSPTDRVLNTVTCLVKITARTFGYLGIYNLTRSSAMYGMCPRFLLKGR